MLASSGDPQPQAARADEESKDPVSMMSSRETLTQRSNDIHQTLRELAPQTRRTLTMNLMGTPTFSSSSTSRKRRKNTGATMVAMTVRIKRYVGSGICPGRRFLSRAQKLARFPRTGLKWR